MASANMRNGILCATDFSASSNEALRWSVQLAECLNSPLTILYAYRLLRNDVEATEVKKKTESEALRNFAILEREFLAKTAVTYNYKVEVGFIDDRIEDHVRKNKISFIVMGKNMTVKNKETFDDLMENLNIPLVIVPEIIN